MNYSLAKELKEAGFKLSDRLHVGIKEDNTPLTVGDEGTEVKYLLYPDLSELISACGECLSHIKRLPVEGKEYWWAVSHCGHPEHEPGGNNLEEQGSTPEEAVARLWLALNKK